LTVREEVMEALGRCYDPCCQERGISIVDMGLIEDVRIVDEAVAIDVILTTGWCPSVANIHQMVIDEVSTIDGVGAVDVNVVFDPVWTMDRLSPGAREKLEMDLEPLKKYRDARLAGVTPGSVSIVEVTR
jgi:metal-sulfur cluster biosynthetic enzyme